ncbi:MAG: hypothetical protein M9892_03335 [Bacteroidetes bacterium]|nr:hypothetical protein [Bacteroidota bacterium]
MKIPPLRLTLRTVQQPAFELLLEHYLNCLENSFKEVLIHVIIAELLLKVKQKNILERAQSTYLLNPQQRLSLLYCTRSLPLPEDALVLSVHTKLALANDIKIN